VTTVCDANDTNGNVITRQKKLIYAATFFICISYQDLKKKIIFSYQKERRKKKQNKRIKKKQKEKKKRKGKEVKKETKEKKRK